MTAGGPLFLGLGGEVEIYHFLCPFLRLHSKEFNYIVMKAIHALPLVSWDNGILMIAVFGFVVVALVAAVLMMMRGGKK